MTAIPFPEPYQHADLEMITMYGMMIFKDKSGVLPPIWLCEGDWVSADYGNLLEWEVFQ